MGRTASTILRLIVEESNRYHAGLMPAGMEKPDYIRTAYASDNLKHYLLDSIYANHGPNAILQIGRGIDKAGFTPLWHILLAAVRPDRLLNSWRKIEEFSKARFRIDYIPGANGKGLRIHHYTRFGPIARDTENLLIIGLFLSVFKKGGCQGLRCYMTPQSGPEVLVYHTGDFVDWRPNLGAPTGHWRLEWDNYEIGLPASGLQAPTPPILPLLAEYQDSSGIIESSVSVVKNDLSHAWKIGDLACTLGFSQRSLQRHFQQSELNFSILLRAIRFQQASLLLSNPERSITDISYICGFSDSAHFSRDFRKGVGISPSAYRHVSLSLRHTTP